MTPRQGASHGAPRGAADRVRRSHAQTRTTLRVALAFIVAAVASVAAGSSRWLPLHLFLGGGVALAISGVTLMLTVTWSAAPAPPDRWVATQRVAIAAGAAGIGVARSAELPDPVLAIAGITHLGGIVILAALIVHTVRRGVERRFDVAAAAYLAALLAGATGVVMGILMGVGEPTPSARAAHVAVNLLGLIGLVVAGTMPFFAATVGRARMAPGATPVRLGAAVAWQAATVVVAASALGAGATEPAVAGLVGFAVGIAAVLTVLPRPTGRQLRWAGPRLVALWAGGLWWGVAVVASAVDVATGRVPFGGRWLTVLVLAGYGQILWGSLAYLLPMLRGGGHRRLGEGFAATRSWSGLGAANLAGFAVALDGPVEVVAGAVAVWVADFGWRAARVGWGPRSPTGGNPPAPGFTSSND